MNKRALETKKRWEDPVFRKKMSEAHMGHRVLDETKLKIGLKNSINLLKLWRKQDYRKKMIIAHLGQKAWNKGLKTGVIPRSVFKKGHEQSENWYKIMATRMSGKNNPSYKHGLSGTLEFARILIAKRRALKSKNGGSFTVKEWEDLKKFYGYKCLACLKRKKLAADHIIPITKGGTSYISNIQPLCQHCNSSKYNKVIDYRILWRNQLLV